jgi:hypothetical protein
MKWVTKVDSLKNLQDELRRLEDAAHTIDQVVVVDGKPVIISTTA